MGERCLIAWGVDAADARRLGMLIDADDVRWLLDVGGMKGSTVVASIKSPPMVLEHIRTRLCPLSLLAVEDGLGYGRRARKPPIQPPPKKRGTPADPIAAALATLAGLSNEDRETALRMARVRWPEPKLNVTVDYADPTPDHAIGRARRAAEAIAGAADTRRPHYRVVCVGSDEADAARLVEEHGGSKRVGPFEGMEFENAIVIVSRELGASDASRIRSRARLRRDGKLKNVAVREL